MGRQFFLITALLIVIPVSGYAQGQRGNGRRGGMGNAGQFRGPMGPSHFSPQDRQMFRRNAERWLKMDAQQQQVLRDRERVRQQQIRSEVDTAIRQSGLHLDQQGRAQFETRYRQERRMMERALREEFESKRQQELPQLNERLKKEFQTHQGIGSPSASPGK
ncbi:MAG TPA: hypothetical protein VGM62_20455 [Chthoniobacterales bacterium]